MKAGVRVLVALGLVLALGAATGTAAAAPDNGTTIASKGCNLSADEARSLGASYVYPLKVRNTGCSKGKKVAKAFNQCRKDHGGADGRCRSRVLGFKCDEGKRTSSPTQYSAHVVCKNGDKKVVFDYTQNT